MRRAPTSRYRAPPCSSAFPRSYTGFMFFRDHGWRVRPRVPAPLGCVTDRDCTRQGGAHGGAGRAADDRAARVGVGLLDLHLREPAAIAIVALAYTCSAVMLGTALAAVLSTVQQLNAIGFLGATVLGAIGGRARAALDVASLGAEDLAGHAAVLGDARVPERDPRRRRHAQRVVPARSARMLHRGVLGRDGAAGCAATRRSAAGAEQSGAPQHEHAARHRGAGRNAARRDGAAEPDLEGVLPPSRARRGGAAPSARGLFLQHDVCGHEAAGHAARVGAPARTWLRTAGWQPRDTDGAAGATTRRRPGPRRRGSRQPWNRARSCAALGMQLDGDDVHAGRGTRARR